MRNVGDVTRARQDFLERPSNNLRFLLENRYAWMNDFIEGDAVGVELGSGTGVSKKFIRAHSFIITDFADHEWLDVKTVDALRTPFAAGSFDFVVASNMIHHVPFPLRFFEECHRILKPGGLILIQEVNASLFLRLILRLMRHEGYSFDAQVFNRNSVCTDENDLWSANCAIPNILFDDQETFHKQVPGFRIVHSSHSEFLLFLNSGGVIAKAPHLPLPFAALRIVRALDTALSRLLPEIFALQRQIVLARAD